MARIRSLKPELPSDRKLASLPMEVRYTFVLILSRSDDYGLLLAEPRQLLGELFPHDDLLTEKKLLGWVEMLVVRGFLRWRETRDGARVIEVVNWKKHQMVKHPGKPLLLKRLQPYTGNPPESLPQSSGIPPAILPQVSGDLGGAERERERERDKGEGKGTQTVDLAVEVFEQAWENYPKRPNNSKAAAKKAWDARVRERCDLQAMLAGVRAYAAFCLREGTAPKYIKQAATFFGPDKHWEADYGSDAELVRITDESGTPTRTLLDALGVRAPA